MGRVPVGVFAGIRVVEGVGSKSDNPLEIGLTTD